MEGWQRKSREKREFLSGKFREARALVERLAQENNNLLGKLNCSGSHVAPQGTAMDTKTACQNQNQESSCTDGNGLTEESNVSLHKQCHISFYFSIINLERKHSISPYLIPDCFFCFILYYQDLAVIERKVNAEQDIDRQAMPRSLVVSTCFFSLHHKMSGL